VVAAFLAVLIAGSLVGVQSMQNGRIGNIFVKASAENPSAVTVNFIDVGQGDSIFIDTSDKDVLIDGGPTDAGQTVLNYLSSLGIMHINLMIATHVHEDHIGGLITILSSAIITEAIWINGQTDTSNAYKSFITLAHGHATTVAQRGQTYILTATVNLTVFNPVQPLEFTDTNHVNYNSIVVRLQAGNTSFLLTGDADADAEQSMLNAGLNLHCNVLKVGHHGSRYATTQLFLDRVAPSYAIISAGKNNPYGHPSPETVQRLLAKGVTTYATFQSGTIVASTDGTSITFQDSPQPIPEFGSEAILPILMAVALSAIIVYRKTTSANSKHK